MASKSADLSRASSVWDYLGTPPPHHPPSQQPAASHEQASKPHTSQPSQPPSKPPNPQKYIKIYKNTWNPWNPRKFMNIDETAASWDRVKVSLRAPSRPQRVAEAAKPPTPEIHEISWNRWKSMKINEIARQPASPAQSSQPAQPPDPMNRWIDDSSQPYESNQPRPASQHRITESGHRVIESLDLAAGLAG